MQLVRGLGSLSWCRCSISPKHTPSSIGKYILQDRSHVLHLRMKRRYQEVLDHRQHWKQEGLQIQVAANGIHKKWQRTVRSWAKRRVEQALTEQLRARSFDRGGRRLRRAREAAGCNQSGPEFRQPNGAPSTHDKSEDLCGSIRVQLLENVVGTKYADLHHQAGMIIDGFLRQYRGRIIP